MPNKAAVIEKQETAEDFEMLFGLGITKVADGKKFIFGWDCPICKKNAILQEVEPTLKDLGSHFIAAHPEQAQNWCISHGIPQNEYDAMVAQASGLDLEEVLPEPEPEPEPVQAPEMVCPHCGKIYKKSVGHFNAHVKKCGVPAKVEAPPEPKPVAPTPVVVVAPAPVEEPVLSLREQAEAIAKIGVDWVQEQSAQAKAMATELEDTYRAVELNRLVLQKINEALPNLAIMAGAGRMVRQYQEAIAKRDALEEFLLEASYHDDYVVGESLAGQLQAEREGRIKKGNDTASKHNQAQQAIAYSDALKWKQEQEQRYTDLFCGRLRLRNSQDEAVLLLADVNRTVSSDVSKLSKAKAFDLGMEFGLCADAAGTMINGLFKAENSVVHHGTRLDVDENGIVHESKYKWVATETLNLGIWIDEVARAVKYCRNQFRKSGHKTGVDEAMQQDDFVKAFGVGLTAQDTNQELVQLRWHNPNAKKRENTNPDGSNPNESTFAAAMRKAKEKDADRVEKVVSNDPDGDPDHEEIARGTKARKPQKPGSSLDDLKANQK